MEQTPTGLSGDFAVLGVSSEDDLEWDHTADVLVKPSTSKSKRDDRSAYELAEYIVKEFVPQVKQQRAHRLIKLWKSGKRAYSCFHSFVYNF